MKNEEKKTVPKQGMYDFLYRPKYIRLSTKCVKKLEEDSILQRRSSHSWEGQHCLMCQTNEQQRSAVIKQRLRRGGSKVVYTSIGARTAMRNLAIALTHLAKR